MMLISSSAFLGIAAGNGSGNGLFDSVWEPLGYCYIVSDNVFPLNVYVVSLPDVGNYRVANHSDVVEGVRQAVVICPGDSQIKELHIEIGHQLYMKLNVNVSCTMVEDWGAYKTLVESANNSLIVNTHDEYLPVPESYTKEEWTEKVADFMLNRWGTWVHAGGYPFYRVWHQNGTTEEWGDSGFKRLMSHIGKGNVTCYPREDIDPDDPDSSNRQTRTTFFGPWYWYFEMDGHYDDGTLNEFCYANPGYPVKTNELDVTHQVYVWAENGKDYRYTSGAAIRFSPNASSFNFGRYIHLSSWKFWGAHNDMKPSSFSVGFISTAVAIEEEYYFVSARFYGNLGYSASEAILKAEKEGRIIGLAEAETLFRDGLDAFAAGNYKLAAAYANQAKITADRARIAPSFLPQITATATILTASVVGGVYYKIKKKKEKQARNQKT